MRLPKNLREKYPSVEEMEFSDEVKEILKKMLSPETKKTLLNILEDRFEANGSRHPELKWEDVRAKLEDNPEKLWSLNEMERTGGEPDVIEFDEKIDALPDGSKEYVFVDCSAESPLGRRDVSYNLHLQKFDEKKGKKPKGNAVDMAEAMGISILTESEYRELHKKGDFDRHSSCWLYTPTDLG